MGDLAGGRRFPLKMYGMWPSGHDRAENGREKCPGPDEGSGEAAGITAKKLAKTAKKCLLLCGKSAKIFIRDTLKSLLLKLKSRARDHKEVKQ